MLQTAVSGGNTTPPSGDTTGYWQQRADYSIVAHLDEGLLGFTAQGKLRYVNNSPDTLREMYFHQYLNAFKPGSKWSALDERENRERFQNLREPDYGYERFTRAPLVDGTAGEPGAELTLEHVLLVEKDGGEVVAGAPFVANAKILAVVEGEARGPKIRVFKKKRRKGMRRTKGHRATYTRLRIKDIVL